jgi:hypothetical protein
MHQFGSSGNISKLLYLWNVTLSDLGAKTKYPEYGRGFTESAEEYDVSRPLPNPSPCAESDLLPSHHTLISFCTLIWMIFSMEYRWRTSKVSKCLSFELQQDVSVVTLCFSHSMGHCTPTRWCQSLRSAPGTGPNTASSTLPFSFVTKCVTVINWTALHYVAFCEPKKVQNTSKTEPKKTMNPLFHIYLF